MVQYKGKKFEPKNEKEAQSAVDFLNKSHYVVTDLETNQQVLNQEPHLLLQPYNKLQVRV